MLQFVFIIHIFTNNLLHFIFTAKKNEICSFFICPCFVRPSLVNKHFHDNKKTVPQVTNILGVSLFFSECR